MTYMKRILPIILLVLAASCADRTSFEIRTEDGLLSLTPLTDNSIRVRMTTPETAPLEELFYTRDVAKPSFKVLDGEQSTMIVQKNLLTVYHKDTGLLEFVDGEGVRLFFEKERAIGRLSFVSPADEHQYGLGQFQDGYLDVKGLTRRLTQVNTQISIPFLMSSGGYGVMWNSYGLTEFNPCCESIALDKFEEGGSALVNATGTSGNRREQRFFETFTGKISVPEEGEYSLLLDVGQSMARKHFLMVDDRVLTDCNNTWLPPTTSLICHLEAGEHSVEVQGVRGDRPVLQWRRVDEATTFCSPNADRLDYTVFAGGADEVIGAYRSLTGEAPLMPSWMLGYIHCRERYDTQKELLENAREFKARGIPVDVIVQDWQWWGKYGWNAMRFDEDKYPDPKAMVDSLHDMDMKLMVSVWSKVSRESVLGQSLQENGCYIEDTEWIDYFEPESADLYWRNFRDSLVRYGIDAWWFDATEPENDDLAGRYEQYRNVYPLKVLQTIYGGLRTVKPEEEPVILTRSLAPGIQRYGAICWSGDVGNDWETLRRQIAGGLGLMSSGLPWWTYDAGGFFRPADQYTDRDYQERMVRWIQTSVWLPLMRVHGYMSRTEPWNYPEDIYKLYVAAIEQRQALRPYLEECARKVAEDGYTMMRPLYFDFSKDDVATAISDEYMLGPRYLVCPVLAAGVKSMEVYLPETEGGWTDIRDGSHYEPGRQTVSVDINAIPVFERN